MILLRGVFGFTSDSRHLDLSRCSRLQGALCRAHSSLHHHTCALYTSSASRNGESCRSSSFSKSGMWNDEDNNPYGSFQRRDSNTSDQEDQSTSIDSRKAQQSFKFAASHNDDRTGFRRSSTPLSDTGSPSNETSDTYSRPKDSSDTEEEQDTSDGASPKKKSGGYKSRIEQILYEHQDLQITITHAGKNLEGGGSYIAYTIRTAVCLSQLVNVAKCSQGRIGYGSQT